MADALAIFTIYESPKDYPGRIVVRRSEVNADGARVDPEPLAVVLTLAEARIAIESVQPGLICLGRNPSDDPVIVECWL
jgi:hypothetical protein